MKNIHNDMKIAEMMGYAEFVTGVPKFMQRIRYLDECKCADLRVVRTLMLYLNHCKYCKNTLNFHIH